MITREEKNKQIQKDIKKEEVKEKVTKHFWFFFRIILAIALIFIGFILYARYIGTTGLIVREYKIESNRLPKSFHGFKIVHFTDLHYGSTIHQNEINELVETINKLKPDLIVFTGDLIDKDFKYKEEDEKIIEQAFKNMKATIGKYAVTGNHDYTSNNFSDIMKNSDFIVLDNQYELLYNNDYTPILLTGVSSSVKGKIDIQKAFSYFNEEVANKDIFTISLLHEPDNIDSILTNYSVDIALSGHSHNGQIRLPFVGAIVKVKDAKKYSNEYYEINNTDLFISGGLGTSTYKFRLFNRPSINFYRLSKE